MIDILGMLLPGGLMMLLLEMDYGLFQKMGSYFTIEAGNVLWSAVFLCASYFMGMLLHEIGSVIEKLMWRNPLLNPRVYAAISTDLLFNYARGKAVPPVEKLGDLEKGQSLWENLRISRSNSWLIGIIDNRTMKGVARIIRGIWRVILSLIAWWVVFYVVGEMTPRQYIGWVVATVLACILLQWKAFSKFLAAVSDVGLRERMKQIVNDERVIQKESVTSEENSRKYGLFCGYYSLMRSVLVLIAIFQKYVVIQTGLNTSHIVQFYQHVKEFKAYPYLRYIVVVALILRYWHYACAKYTYTYNGYISNKLYPKSEDKATKVHVEFEKIANNNTSTG